MQIDIEKVINYIRDNSNIYAKAKSERIYIEEFRKSKKALLMRKYAEQGISSSVAQETYAYSDDEYIELLSGLREAVEREESLRWMLIAAQAKLEAWRTLESTRRFEAKII